MKPWKVVLIALGAAVVSAAITDARQERDATYPQTRQWEVTKVDTERVSVVETAGVCLYLLTNSFNHMTSMTAVSKSQLPAGAGCQ